MFAILQVALWVAGISLCGTLIETAVNQVKDTSDTMIQRNNSKCGRHSIPDIWPNRLGKKDLRFDRDGTANCTLLE